MTYKQWVEYAIVEYDLISSHYSKRIYEAVVKNKETGKNDFVQLTLRDVLNKCMGTNYEEAIKRAIMKCVYTDAKLSVEVRKVMDQFFEVQE